MWHEQIHWRQGEMYSEGADFMHEGPGTMRLRGSELLIWNSVPDEFEVMCELTGDLP